MPILSDVDLVVADLEDSLAALNIAGTSPKEVRQCLSRFVDLSQRLTSVMRKEWSARGRGSWKASDFHGWSATTALFKELRNHEQHESPLYISVEETRHYELFGLAGGTIAYSGTWQLTDQTATIPPDWLRMYDSDPDTGEKTTVEIPHCTIGYRYLIQARDDELTAKLQAVGLSDIHQLCNACMATLRDYHAFYRARVAA